MEKQVKHFLRELELISNRYGIAIELGFVPGGGSVIELTPLAQGKRARYDYESIEPGAHAFLETYIEDYANPLAARPPVRIGMPIYVPAESMQGTVCAINGPDVWINLKCDPARRIRAKISEVRTVESREGDRARLDGNPDDYPLATTGRG